MTFYIIKKIKSKKKYQVKKHIKCNLIRMKCIILQKGNVFKFIDLVLKIKNFMTFFPYTSNYAMFRSQDQDKESDRYKETPTLPLISPWYSSTGKLNSTVV